MIKPPYVYADNAATTQLFPEVLEAMLPFLKDNFGNPSSPYSFSHSAKKALQSARERIAECIGAMPEEIFFTSGGSESDNWAIKNFVFSEFHRQRKILISPIEHHAIINSCVEAAKRFGFTIISTPVDEHGKIIFQKYRENVSEHIDGISIMLANNEIGTIEDITALSEIAKEYKIPFHTDAVQAIGHIPINVRKLGVDMLSASAHKFNGPKGIGFLFVRKGMPLVNFIDGGQQEFGLRAGTENVAAIVGMAVALSINCQNMTDSIVRLGRMTQIFRSIILSHIPKGIFNGDEKFHLPGHISLSLPNISGESLMHLLDLRGVAVSTGAACNSHSEEISHVLRAIDLPESLAHGTIRISFGTNNIESDAITVANEIVSLYNKMTSIKLHTF